MEPSSRHCWQPSLLFSNTADGIAAPLSRAADALGCRAWFVASAIERVRTALALQLVKNVIAQGGEVLLVPLSSGEDSTWLAGETAVQLLRQMDAEQMQRIHVAYAPDGPALNTLCATMHLLPFVPRLVVVFDLRRRFVRSLQPLQDLVKAVAMLSEALPATARLLVTDDDDLWRLPVTNSPQQQQQQQQLAPVLSAWFPIRFQALELDDDGSYTMRCEPGPWPPCVFSLQPTGPRAEHRFRIAAS